MGRCHAAAVFNDMESSAAPCISEQGGHACLGLSLLPNPTSALVQRPRTPGSPVPAFQPAPYTTSHTHTLSDLFSQVLDHAGGKLHVIQLSKRAVTDAASRESRWKEEKVLRVWTPPGFSLEAAPPGGWPVLYMCDGECAWGEQRC